MFGPRMTPAAWPPVRSATAARHALVIASARLLAGKAPPALPRPARYASPIAWITAAGNCVPAAPSRYAYPSASAGYPARTRFTSKATPTNPSPIRGPRLPGGAPSRGEQHRRPGIIIADHRQMRQAGQPRRDNCFRVGRPVVLARHHRVPDRMARATAMRPENYVTVNDLAVTIRLMAIGGSQPQPGSPPSRSSA